MKFKPSRIKYDTNGDPYQQAVVKNTSSEGVHIEYWPYDHEKGEPVRKRNLRLGG